jgi:hypothetical protein
LARQHFNYVSSFNALRKIISPYEAAYVHRRHAAPPYAYDTQANPNYGFGPLVPVDPNDVISGNRIIGRDPDPFIRGEILRHYDSGWPD